MSAEQADDPLVTIEIRQMSVALLSAGQQHSDELTREMMLVAEQLHQQGGSGALPQRFVELVSTVTSRYSMFTAAQEQQMNAAIEAGETSLDLVYSVPRSAAAAAASLGEIFDEVDEYCRAGVLLLTLATPPELVAHRRWFLDQFVEQAAGRPPVPWPDYRAAASTS